MLKVLGAVPPRFKAVREALFGEWRRWFVAGTLTLWGDAPVAACGGWVAALVDAAAAGAEGTKRFHAAVLARWATVHRLRRNLWRDLAKRGLHVSTVGPTSMATTKKPGGASR